MERKLKLGEFALMLTIMGTGIEDTKVIAKDKIGMAKGKAVYELLQPHINRIENELENLEHFLNEVSGKNDQTCEL